MVVLLCCSRDPKSRPQSPVQQEEAAGFLTKLSRHELLPPGSTRLFVACFLPFCGLGGTHRLRLFVFGGTGNRPFPSLWLRLFASFFLRLLLLRHPHSHLPQNRPWKARPSSRRPETISNPICAGLLNEQVLRNHATPNGARSLSTLACFWLPRYQSAPTLRRTQLTSPSSSQA